MGKFLVPIAVVLAGLFIGGAVVWNGSHPAGTDTNNGTVTVDINDVNMEGEPFIGNANAPVVIAEWSDYQCPFCKQYEQVTLPQIIKDYVDAGKVKIVFKDFAFLGADSVVAAEYEHAVWKLYPEQYFAWRTAMFAAQDAEGDAGFGDEASIKALTAGISGIDAAKVSADVSANRAAYDTAMNADRAEAQKYGINATPSFIIGTQVIAGAYPYDTFKAAIDAELAK